MEISEFYSREDVQEELIRCAKDREVGVKFGDKGFGKRPDMLQFKGDVSEYVKQGATSFHLSEERWDSPLNLKTGMSKRQLDDLRAGWDLLLDVDCNHFEYSKIITKVLIEALKFHDINKVSLKFSGNKGFHIGIPFEAFPEKVHNLKIKLWFPDGPRIVAGYLKNMIKEPFLAKLMKDDVDTICSNVGKSVSDVIIEGVLDPFKVADVDTVLISSRHMFRAPYSVNEKSGLISVCLSVDEIDDFRREDASMGNVKKIVKFLDFEEQDASNLIIQAFDWDAKNKTKLFLDGGVPQKNVEYDIPKFALEEKYFPPCIVKALKGGLEDGRKRALFILINFLKNMGWDFKSIKTRLLEWNKTHPSHLRDNYIISQLTWHQKQSQIILPPNCDNSAYYKDLRICVPNNVCKRFKNPINYSLRRFKINKNQKS